MKGYMSFVGPRPALYNQDDLIALRTEKGIHKITPGITGWAQINGRDDIPIPKKVEYDEYYLNHRALFFDLKILFLTFLKVTRAENVSH
jgi:O-antigen biosynthesis protein WbqP